MTADQLRLIWDKPVRRCYSLHSCKECGRDIVLGERYYDGGFGWRYHELCVDQATNELAEVEKSKEAQ